MTNLGGHCMETLVEAFDSAVDQRPTLFIAYTVKGYGLPFVGHAQAIGDAAAELFL